ncbi:MAG: hypothetical protein ACPGGK_10715 [Pikeienuella sp.]
MKRVVVIGNAGAGKSTLCRAISGRLGLLPHAIDHLYWRPGWQPAPEAEFRAAHDAILCQNLWMIDGFGPWFSVEQRLSACDTIIYIDLPLRIHLWRAAKRQMSSLFFDNPDVPAGCTPWRVTFRLFRMIWQLHIETRPKLIEAIYEQADHARIVHLRSTAELDAFAANPV